ncbi:MULTISPECIES: hypothetical protein [unclassified Rhizobium]|uniref:hypothetical protein n=1 Tax=unclassified Rhizobium TaxID=2613769 RepID=UPI0007EBC72B|nr:MULTISPECIES: hypothetical protein [unclassified Rhizobium]ANM10392.1 hypothetical protein AMK05_CH02006 [Rhizobium sp. N324]ANM16877.1 hypothetical protein AMK06_CH01975 [Rhizobium sp. N541]ANM23262.1 hypothetical protein AMK07_CH01972 [Rhizobium sp. N941]OYD03722.1 hypothetical protein AMK08_CH101740 [Rhizobium sp. N4311]
MSIATSQTDRLGANPFVVDGPFVPGSGVPAPQFALGSIAGGDRESEWVYCQLVLASQTTLQPGQWFQWTRDYVASLLTTAAAVVGQRCGVFAGAAQPPTITGGPIGTITLAAGTYYLWLQRNGQAPSVVATATAALVVAETTTTAGQASAPASATATTKAIANVNFAAANQTFTATTVNGSNLLTALASLSATSGPFIGAAVAGTGIPGGATITGITYSPNGVIQSITLSANATANGTGITITATGVLEATLMRPFLSKVN